MSFVFTKIVGSIDNNNITKEIFRASKKYNNLLIEPKRKQTIVLPDGDVFYIDDVVQNMKLVCVFLFEYYWITYSQSVKSTSDKLKKEYKKQGWIIKEHL
jgi:hypothetical protein